MSLPVTITAHGTLGGLLVLAFATLHTAALIAAYRLGVEAGRARASARPLALLPRPTSDERWRA